MKAIIAMGALALLFAPAALAAVVVDTKDATSQLPEDVRVVADGAGQYYLADDGTLWMESNGIAGLQQSAGTAQDGVDYAADTLIEGAPQLPAVPL
jgi:hypothetical protein